MSMYYTHTLIPDQPRFTPHPRQVGGFLSTLMELGAAPSEVELQVVKPHEAEGFPGTRRLPDRFGEDPFTGEILVLRGRLSTPINDISAIASVLEGLDEYDVRMSGNGPPEPLFPFLPVSGLPFDPREEPYEFRVSCHQRPDVVSMSDHHRDEWASTRMVAALRRLFAPPSFGTPCTTARKTGFFTNPTGLETIRMPRAGCARFWIEFAFGKFLFPEIKNNSLDLLPTRVVAAAMQIFGVRFAQGCVWG